MGLYTTYVSDTSWGSHRILRSTGTIGNDFGKTSVCVFSGKRPWHLGSDNLPMSGGKGRGESIILTFCHLLLGSTGCQTAWVGKHHSLVIQMFEVALPRPPYVRVPGWETATLISFWLPPITALPFCVCALSVRGLVQRSFFFFFFFWLHWVFVAVRGLF